MAKIEHIALWTSDMERCVKFYVTYFGAIPGPEYVNSAKGFRSVFLQFSDGARIEIMKTTSLSLVDIEPGSQRMGLTHFAISLGSEFLVDELTLRMKNDGLSVMDGPRRTGDGYYESVVLDPDGNRVELVG